MHEPQMATDCSQTSLITLSVLSLCWTTFRGVIKQWQQHQHATIHLQQFIYDHRVYQVRTLRLLRLKLFHTGQFKAGGWTRKQRKIRTWLSRDPCNVFSLTFQQINKFPILLHLHLPQTTIPPSQQGLHRDSQDYTQLTDASGLRQALCESREDAKISFPMHTLKGFQWLRPRKKTYENWWLNLSKVWIS